MSFQSYASYTLLCHPFFLCRNCRLACLGECDCIRHTTDTHANLYVFLVQELQTGNDLGVGVKGIKAIKPFLAQLIVTDGTCSR